MTNKEFLESIILEGEEWRDVVGWEELYAVSNFGRVASYGRFQLINGGGYGKIHVISFPPKVLKLQNHRASNGRQSYLSVMLRDKERCSRLLVHRIVAQAFISNPSSYPHIDHIDADKHNNHVENLRWCTPTMNMRNPLTKNAISAKAKGKTAHNRRRVLCFKGGTLIKEFPSLASVKLSKFSPPNVYLCCVGRQDTHKGYRWMYADDYETSNQ